MKKITLAIVFALVLSGCQNQAAVDSQPTAAPSVAESEGNGDTTSPEYRYELVITGQNFGTEELYAQKGEKLTISVRNQLEEPINITIDELAVRSQNIEFGQVAEVSIPTDEVGEFEMYSSVGSQREEGFSALLIIEE